MREDKEEVPQQNHNMTFSAQRSRGRRGNNNTLIQEKDALSLLDEEQLL